MQETVLLQHWHFQKKKGMSLEETVRLSTATGAANVMCSGTQAAEYEAISELISKVAMHTM